MSDARLRREADAGNERGAGGEAGGLLARLEAQGVLEPGQAVGLAQAAMAPAVPAWLQVLQALAAWFAALLILSSFMLPLALVGDRALLRVLVGGLLCGGALWLFRREQLFTDQMALAFSLAGQALLVSAMGEGWGALWGRSTTWAMLGALIAAAMMVPRTARLHRALCGLILAFDVAVVLGSGPGLALFAVGLLGMACALWLMRAQWAAGLASASALPPGLLAAVAHAATLAALALPLAVSIGDGVGGRVLLWAPFGGAYGASLLSVGATLVLAAVALHLLREASPRARALALGAGLVLALASQPAPGLIVAAALFLACFHGGQRLLGALAVLAAVLYVGEYYYRLETTLLNKSMLLAASGLVLLGLRQGLVGHRRGASQ